MKICVTGSNGFVGSALLPALTGRGHEVVAVTRASGEGVNRSDHIEWVHCDLEQSSLRADQLVGVDVVVHLAGRAHVLREQGKDPLAAFRRANVEATRKFAEASAQAGVKRFVFVSSIGVHGSSLANGETVTEASSAVPMEPYGISKLEAEEALWEVSGSSGMDVVVLRPALVAGYGAPGNLARLGKLINRGVPVPVPLQDNARSFVSLNNLNGLVLRTLEAPAASGETFLAAEQTCPSTLEVMSLIGEGLGRPVRSVPLPGPFLRLGAKAVGKSDLYDKIFGDLRVDATKARQQLGWDVVEPLGEALRDVGRGLRS
ncbi:NAD-dependent epimerase/dehydratase family protein [Thiohalorhabdus denitrificans]|uniref:Nucleoside-diphosphate-sugar epimerase n=2 Tax=Thiohalorhabdus denitrificans TaxID=381306 RepID=A0A1G5ANB6_9GAMM|nr:Nucleoside-diphosphate-sugar epimerase [Thiohalorhabdus denitrificans]